jgi:hypothetical protein
MGMETIASTFPEANDCARLVSAGPNGMLETALADADASGRGDDRVLFIGRADPGRNRSCE